jgi:aspartyl/glutamyl-tRNA(Asn/Gln) amidotransferase C subunit
MPVTREDIRRVAALAELAVDEGTAAELEVQLSRILDYVRRLEALDAAREAGAEAPVAGADVAGVRLRPDSVGSDALTWPPRAFAPAMRDDLFLVPRLGGMGGGAGDDVEDG